jgi:hypothetical protein
MMESLGKTVEPAGSDKEKLKQEFVKEVRSAFDLNSKILGEEEGALRCLEKMILGASEEMAYRSVERMDKLEEQFKDYTFEQALRYQN